MTCLYKLSLFPFWEKSHDHTLSSVSLYSRQQASFPVRSIVFLTQSRTTTPTTRRTLRWPSGVLLLTVTTSGPRRFWSPAATCPCSGSLATGLDLEVLNLLGRCQRRLCWVGLRLRLAALHFHYGLRRWPPTTTAGLTATSL